MKSQLKSFINWLVVFVHSLLSNPQRVRLVLTVIAIALVLAALFVPQIVSLADHMGGSGS